MPLARCSLVLVAAGCLLGANQPQPRVAPDYTTASIVNAADNQSGALAPNAIATIYGANLSYSTASIGASNIYGTLLPTVLGSSETRVFVNNYPANLYYVSPTQINFLVPPNLSPGPAVVQVLTDSLSGPLIQLTLGAAAPGLFQLDAQTVIATAADGSLLTSSSPAKPGDIIILWATGLGVVSPPAVYGQLPMSAAPLAAGENLSILFDGVAVDPSAIQYAGLAPGYAGLYQINLLLPVSTGANPEIRLQLDGATSIAGVHLPVSP